MVKLELHFTTEQDPQLQRVVFSHPLLEEERISVRGRNSFFLQSPYTFQWTSAVRALSIFFLHNAVWGRRSEASTDKPRFSGEKGSLPATLDYALSQQPQWLLDMFAVDRRNKTLARRLIQRFNPERKRPGPVTLTLNERTLSALDINILLNGSLIQDAEQLTKIAQQIEENLSTKEDVSHISTTSRPISSDKTATASSILSKDILKNLVLSESFEMLWRTDIFNPSKLRKTHDNLRSNPSVTKLIGDSSHFIDELDLTLPSAQRLGMGIGLDKLKQEINRKEPIRAIVPVMWVGALAIFEYLRRVKGFHIEIDIEWGYSAEVRRAVRQGSLSHAPDLFILGSGPATTALGQLARISYQPLMLVPNISHRVILPGSALAEKKAAFNYGEYQLLHEEASTPEFCFEDLERRGFLSRKQVHISHLEPDEATYVLAQGNPDLKMIMFFPHYSFNELFNNCRAIRFPTEEMSMQESILFAHNSFLADRKRATCLDIALRNAWLELRENPRVLSSVVDLMVQDDCFVKSISRFCGLHNLSVVRSEEEGNFQLTGN